MDIAFRDFLRSYSNLCPICQKPDWCLVASDKSAAICARISNGSQKRCGNAGWLHILRENNYRPRSFIKRISIDVIDASIKNFSQLVEKYQLQLTHERLCTFSESLGVSVASLKRLRTGWDGMAFTFPMSDAAGNIVGIRRRFQNSLKVSATGSRTGLFVPIGLDSDRTLLVCEGPTDTAAALDLDFNAIGRPNCNSRIEMTTEAARGRREIVIVGDNDDVGRGGAQKLANAMVLYYPCVKIIFPPAGVKDLRQWLYAGLTSLELHRIIQGNIPVKMELR